jgi:hemolysin activation/secretion protein
MLDLLAQLVAPPLQNSPVRLPGPDAVEQRPRPDQQAPILELSPGTAPSTPAPASPSAPSEPGPASALPNIRGPVRYSQAELRRILATCLAITDPASKLEACAAALTARLVADGYVNSGAYVRGSGAGAYLDVVEGRLVEVRVSSTDARLQRRAQRLLQPLQGKVLNLNTLQQDLLLLKRVNGVGAIKAGLTRLGEDPAQAVFTLTITPGRRPWQGELAVRNDGSPGSGEFRGNTALLKGDLALSGDTLLLYGETSWTDDPTIGQVIGSISYTLPLSEQFNFSGSFGYTRNESPELDGDGVDVSSDQYQGLGQLEWVFSESLRQRWSAFAGISINTNTLSLAVSESPDLSLTQNTTYLRLGVNGNGLSGPVAWGGNVYLLQGLSTQFVDAGSATAVGGLAQAGWSLAPGWQLNGRLAGQVALGDLPTSMYFSVGSDVGLRGLPGQLISGENGWLGTAELAWTFWQSGSHALQLVPFIGAGGVSSTIANTSFDDTVGSGGVLARWLANRNWAVELGWVQQFETNDNLGVWNDWVLDDGLYAKVSFRF